MESLEYIEDKLSEIAAIIESIKNPKWEYMFWYEDSVIKGVSKEINKFGQENWEMVSANFVNSQNPSFVIIMKRRIK